MFRTTASSINSQALQFANRFNTNIALYHKQISSGERLHRPSDEPVGFRQIISVHARLQELNADLFSVQDTEAKLNQSVSQLTTVNQLIVTAKTLTQQAIQANSQSERDAIAIELESILRSVQDIAQTKAAGAFLYGGTRTDQTPFRFGNEIQPGGTLAVEYLGSSLASQAYVGQSVTVKSFYSGTDIFGAPGRKATQVYGLTGARSGSGTDNIIGRATLQVRHTATTYQAGSGIAVGTSSAGNDTVIGPLGSHTIRIIDTSGDGSAGTISLNNGPPVAFTNSDTNLAVKGGDGHFIYVNTTSITPGFDGDIALSATGTLSVDGGATTTAINFSGNQIVSVGSSGKFAHIDSTAIRRTGDDYLEFPGSSNAFQVLHELIQDLRGTRPMDNLKQADSLGRRLGDLETVSDKILETVGNQSASLRTLQQLGSRIEDFKLESELRLNDIQSTNIPQAILKMKNDQSLLEYTYAITANIMSVQLINFLR
jgi:flagellin-like hook-associated protein FlgL